MAFKKKSLKVPSKVEAPVQKDADLDDLVQSVRKAADDIIGPDLEDQIKYHLRTGSTLLDLSVLHGFPGGRVTEIFGPPGSCKSGLAVSVCKEAQDCGGFVLWFAAEPFPYSVARIEELDMSERAFLKKDTNCAERIFQTTETVIDRFRGTGRPLAIVVDSIGALKTNGISKAAWGEATPPGELAKVLDFFFKRDSQINMLTEPIWLILINQIRAAMKISSFGQGYEPPEVADFKRPGGYALEHAAHLAIQCQRLSDIVAGEDQKDVVIGRVVEVKVTKNKSAPFPRKVKLRLYSQPSLAVKGIDDIESCLEWLRDQKALKQWVNPKTGKSPSGIYQFGEHHGSVDTIWEMAYSNPAIAEEVKNYTREVYIRKFGMHDPMHARPSAIEARPPETGETRLESAPLM